MRHSLPALPLLSLLFIATTISHAEEPTKFPPVAPPAADVKLGDKIQRTMRLLAESTPEHRNTVRILFYGQSITEQEWWQEVARDLRARFPHADLVIENRAIGGFGSQLLVHTAEHDLYSFCPDLLIFHVYGGNQEYERIIASTRRRTTAEILMQKDHVTQWPNKDVKPEEDKGAWWSELMNNHLLPEIAGKYNAALVDVRGPWAEYLRENNLQPKALLKDDVHLNEHGNFLMAELIKRYLVRNPDASPGVPDDAVSTLPIGEQLKPTGNELILEFTGNRVDVLFASAASTAAPLDVRIDGKKPSEFPGCYTITRPSPTQAGFWPGITEVSWQQPLLVEDWTAKITEVTDDGAKFKFVVVGSQTGPDGEGTNSERFVSRSGRVVIEPGNWHLPAAQQFVGKKITPGFEVHWQVRPLFVDSLAPPAKIDPTKDNAVTIAQGLPNTQHRLTLTGEQLGAIKAVRIYRPPLAEEVKPAEEAAGEPAQPKQDESR